MTKPAESGTKPTAQRAGRAWPLGLVLGLSVAWTLVQAIVNSASVTSDLARRGLAFHAAQPWIWEFSSATSMLLCLGPTLWFAARLPAWAPRWRWRLPALVPASMVFCLCHVLGMVALRHLAYRVLGWHYDFGDWPAGLLYEYRKDALSFAVMLGLAALVRRLLDAAPSPPAMSAPEPQAVAAAAPAPTFLVRTALQGDLLVRSEDIDWIEAQGNYVALHVDGEQRLLRQTLAQMETGLQAHGFIRTHRRALVNRRRMQAIMPPECARPGVRLTSGELAPLSESRRAEVLRLLLGPGAARPTA